MAGMSQRQELQHAHCTRFLNYGHLGTITYHKDDRSWRPLRIVEPHVAGTGHTNIGEDDDHSTFPLRHISSKVVYGGPAATQSLAHFQTSQSVHEDIDESDSGNSILSTSNTTKADATGTNNQPLEGDAPVLAEKQCPNRSELLALGSAVHAAPDRARSELVCIPIAASVSGNSAESVRLAKIKEEVVESRDTDGRDTSSHFPCISSEDEAHWTSSGGPVQQVCFAAASGYSSTWMAARLQSSTTIFHPLIHRRPVPPRHEMSQPSSLVLPSSVLDANPVFTIPISRTGGHSHADVAFHPQDHSKLALIDGHGNWSVWVIHGERQETLRCRFRIDLLFCGKIWTWDHEKRLRTSLPYHDGWHRMLWCSTSESPSDGLFILNRRTAAVYNLSGHLLGLKDFNLGHAREHGSILDVKPSTTVSGHYFVLTSTRLFWVNLEDRPFEQSGRAARNSHLLLAWQHFRDRADKTLHLVLLETGMTTIVLLCSRVVDLVLVFRVGMVNSNRNFPVSLSDPFSIVLPAAPRHTKSRSPPFSLLFRPIQSRRRVEVGKRTEHSFFKLFSLDDDLSVVERLFSSTERGFVLTAGAAESIILPLPIHSTLRQRRLEPSDPKDLEGFIVPDDWVEGVEDPTAARPQRCTGDSREKTPFSRIHPRVDWHDVYAYLTDKDQSSTPNARTKMSDFIRQFSEQRRQNRSSGIKFLSEILPFRLHITDVDHDSKQFDRLSSTFGSQQGHNIKVERLSIFTPEGRARTTLTSLYDALIATQLTPLPLQAADRVRVNKERLVRRVTADLLLASTSICPVPAAPGATLESESARSRSQPIASSASLPTTSQPTNPSSLPISTPTPIEDPILTRLRTYTTITPPPTCPIPPLTTNPAITTLLRHLPTSSNTDPQTYSWHTTERTLVEEEQLSLSANQADPRARRKAEKARLARARREEARRRTAEEMAASQRAPPTVLSSSQFPGVGVGAVAGVGFRFGTGSRADGRVQSSQLRAPTWDAGVGSSQGQGLGLGGETAMAMTQPERGGFGSRPGVGLGIGAGFGFGRKNAKGKKRAAGF